MPCQMWGGAGGNWPCQMWGGVSVSTGRWPGLDLAPEWACLPYRASGLSLGRWRGFSSRPWTSAVQLGCRSFLQVPPTLPAPSTLLATNSPLHRVPSLPHPPSQKPKRPTFCPWDPHPPGFGTPGAGNRKVNCAEHSQVRGLDTTPPLPDPAQVGVASPRAGSETCDLREMQGNWDCHFQLHLPSATVWRPRAVVGCLLFTGGARAPSSCLQSCLLKPHTIVGKSRTTGSHTSPV